MRTINLAFFCVLVVFISSVSFGSTMTCTGNNFQQPNHLGELTVVFDAGFKNFKSVLKESGRVITTENRGQVYVGSNKPLPGTMSLWIGGVGDGQTVTRYMAFLPPTLSGQFTVVVSSVYTDDGAQPPKYYKMLCQLS